VASVRTRAAEAHQRAVTVDVASIAQYLQEALGQKLVAYVTGPSDPKGFMNSTSPPCADRIAGTVPA